MSVLTFNLRIENSLKAVLFTPVILLIGSGECCLLALLIPLQRCIVFAAFSEYINKMFHRGVLFLVIPPAVSAGSN